MASIEYYEALAALAREHLGGDFDEIHEKARRIAGGKKRHQVVEVTEDGGSTYLSEEDDLTLVEAVSKKIVRDGSKFCVESETTGRRFGCYPTKEAAVERLRQIEGHKDEEFEVKFSSMDEDRQIVYGIVLEPNEIDAHGDTITEDEIEKAAHKFALTPMVIGDSHRKKAKAHPIETYIYNPTVLKEVKEGSWVMAIKINSDEIWEGVKNGSYTGLSIGAMVKRKPFEPERPLGNDKPNEEEVE